MSETCGRIYGKWMGRDLVCVRPPHPDTEACDANPTGKQIGHSVVPSGPPTPQMEKFIEQVIEEVEETGIDDEYAEDEDLCSFCNRPQSVCQADFIKRCAEATAPQHSPEQKCCFKECEARGIPAKGFDFFACIPCLEELERLIELGRERARNGESQ